MIHFIQQIFVEKLNLYKFDMIAIEYLIDIQKSFLVIKAME